MKIIGQSRSGYIVEASLEELMVLGNLIEADVHPGIAIDTTRLLRRLRGAANTTVRDAVVQLKAQLDDLLVTGDFVDDETSPDPPSR